MDRDSMMELLVDDDFRSENEVGGFFYQILVHGFQGYDSFTDDQLMAELKERSLV